MKHRNENALSVLMCIGTACIKLQKNLSALSASSETFKAAYTEIIEQWTVETSS